MPITPHANGEHLLKWSSSHSYSFLAHNNFVWSANGKGSALTSKASSNINLLNNDTYRLVCTTIIVRSFGQIEQGAPYIGKSLIYSVRNVFLELAVVELVYKFNKKSYRECLKS